MTSNQADYDTPWKQAIEDYFQEFMSFFFAAIAADIDWTREYEFLNTELQQIVRDADLGKRWADKLVKVWRRDGEPICVLIHVEVQSQSESNFAERMFIYNYRIRDKDGSPVVSLAILADESRRWRPDEYQTQLWGCQIQFRFPIVKLIDYRDR